MTLKAVGFDLDDTLYDRREFYRYIFETMQNSIVKLDVSFEYFYEIFQYFSDIEYEKFMQRTKSKEAYKNDRVIDTYQELGVTISQSDAIIFNSLYLYFRDQIILRDEVEKLFTLLLENRYELFILTNGPSFDQRNKLNQLNITQYISEENWFISDELDCTKPNKEIFKKVEGSIGYKKEEVLYIGDDYVNDVVGAKNAGWEAILLNTNPYKNKGVKDDVIVTSSFSEIIQYLKGYQFFIE